MRIVVAGESIQGRRGENQDCLWVKAYRRPKGCLRAVAALADGMGGVQGGRRAAEIAVSVVKEALAHPPEEDSRLVSWTKAVFGECHRRILAEGGADPSLEGMGTTLVLVAVGAAETAVGWEGDSRCYRVTETGAEQVTRDHTILQETLDRGLKTVDQLQESAEYALLSSTLVRGLGGGGESEPEVRRFPITGDEIYLLCSDGLTGSLLEPLVAEEEIHRQLTGNRYPSWALKNLVSLAFQAGSSDNISVAALELGRLPRSKPGVPKEPRVE